ncbi:hypothetical protein ABH922_001130 [Rhodococcus sp. 27YEA15]|uniref:hypothetical protein n=1 Tax=Rhodococcus sp. 27YEA15 TaxID=3156259 RepID=UPI003C7A892E
MPEISYLKIWKFPITGSDAPGDAPENIVLACHAVGRDLQLRRHGTDVYMHNCTWTVSLDDSGHCHINLDGGPRPRHKTAGTIPLRGFGFGGPHVGQSALEATVSIAGEVQDELAGSGDYVLWPIEGERLLMPVSRGGRAVWVVRRTDRVVAEIGALRSP